MYYRFQIEIFESKWKDKLNHEPSKWLKYHKLCIKRLCFLIFLFHILKFGNTQKHTYKHTYKHESKCTFFLSNKLFFFFVFLRHCGDARIVVSVIVTFVIAMSVFDVYAIKNLWIENEKTANAVIESCFLTLGVVLLAGLLCVLCVFFLFFVFFFVFFLCVLMCAFFFFSKKDSVT